MPEVRIAHHAAPHRERVREVADVSGGERHRRVLGLPVSGQSLALAAVTLVLALLVLVALVGWWQRSA